MEDKGDQNELERRFERDNNDAIPREENLQQRTLLNHPVGSVKRNEYSTVANRGQDDPSSLSHAAQQLGESCVTANKRPRLHVDSPMTFSSSSKHTLKARFDDLARTYDEWEAELSVMATSPNNTKTDAVCNTSSPINQRQQNRTKPLFNTPELKLSTPRSTTQFLPKNIIYTSSTTKSQMGSPQPKPIAPRISRNNQFSNKVQANPILKRNSRSVTPPALNWRLSAFQDKKLDGTDRSNLDSASERPLKACVYDSNKPTDVVVGSQSINSNNPFNAAVDDKENVKKDMKNNQLAGVDAQAVDSAFDGSKRKLYLDFQQGIRSDTPLGCRRRVKDVAKLFEANAIATSSPTTSGECKCVSAANCGVSAAKRTSVCSRLSLKTIQENEEVQGTAIVHQPLHQSTLIVPNNDQPSTIADVTSPLRAYNGEGLTVSKQIQCSVPLSPIIQPRVSKPQTVEACTSTTELTMLSPPMLPKLLKTPPRVPSNINLCEEMNLWLEPPNSQRQQHNSTQPGHSQFPINNEARVPSLSASAASVPIATFLKTDEDEIDNIFREALGDEAYDTDENDEDCRNFALPQVIEKSFCFNKSITPSRTHQFKKSSNERRSLSQPCSPSKNLNEHQQKQICHSPISRSKSTELFDSQLANQTVEELKLEIPLKKLEVYLDRVELLIDRASAKMRMCHEGKYSFADLIDSSRSLLSACHRKQAILEEMIRIQSFDSEIQELPHATVSMNTIALPLDPVYMDALSKGQDKRIFYVTCFVHYRSEVITTTMCSTAELVHNAGDHNISAPPSNAPCMVFTNHINFRELTPDFQIKIYIYCLEKKIKGNVKKFREGQIKVKEKTSLRQMLTGGQIGESGRRMAAKGFLNFVQVDAVTIDRSHIGQNRFPLKLSSSKFPFSGHLTLCSDFQLMETVSHSGFLTHYSISAGLGVWQRYWCSIENTKLRLWKNPEDRDCVSVEKPCRVLALSNCRPKSVRLLTFDECARPHTLEVLLLQPSSGDKMDRHWFAADSAMDAITWINSFNKAINTVFYWKSLCVKNKE